MAKTSAILTNGVKFKEAPIGFSWTTLFFGGWPAVFRGDVLIGLGLVVAGVITWGLSNVIAAFLYNKVHIQGLLDNGYKVHTLPYDLTQGQFNKYAGA